MRKQGEIRRLLIDATVHIAAQEGLCSVTTKAISTQAGTSEVNIFRFFGNKEGLLRDTFQALEAELHSCVMQNVSLLNLKIGHEEKWWLLFSRVWEFLLGDYDKCRYYNEYFHSQYFQKYSYQERTDNTLELLEAFSPHFKDGVNVYLTLDYIIGYMLSSALKIIRGDMENNEITSRDIFSMIYNAMLQKML